MEGRSYEGLASLADIQVDERFWGNGSAPVVKEWLAENYDPDTMPTLQVASIAGREGVWLLGWNSDGTEYEPLLTLIFGEQYARRQLDRAQALAAHVEPGVVCPRCHVNRYMPYVPGQVRELDDPAPPALSRVDNATHICSQCGDAEAMNDFAGLPLPPKEDWPVVVPGSFGQGRL
jgi:hypothetical protein